MTKQSIKTTVASVVLCTALVAGLYITKSNADSEPPIVQEVVHQGEVLDNHEARITNTEKNVGDLQTKTNTPPSSTVVTVPSVTTPSVQPTIVPTPTPTPPTITVVAFEQIPEGDSKINCKITYSDGTIKTWLWQSWFYNQGTKITSTYDKCDSSLIGKIKY